MKKPLIHDIQHIADVLPEKWETTMITTTLSGEDAALIVVGKSPYDPAKNYQFQTPVSLRVNHESRMKDGVKLHGREFIHTYINAMTNG